MITQGVVDAIRRRLSELERKALAAIADIAGHETRLDALEALPPAMWESGTYTPTLTSLSVGTGGGATNTADYVFVGGPDTGDEGVLILTGHILFGTSGTTFPSGSERIGLPAGFNVTPNNSTWHTGNARYLIGSNAWTGVTSNDASNADRVRLFADVVSGTGVLENSLTSTVPGSWAAASEIRWTATLNAVRV